MTDFDIIGLAQLTGLNKLVHRVNFDEFDEFTERYEAEFTKHRLSKLKGELKKHGYCYVVFSKFLVYMSNDYNRMIRIVLQENLRKINFIKY